MKTTEPEQIHAAIADLDSERAEERREALAALERVGEPAVWPLIEALSPHGDRSRREIFKALAAIADPAAVSVFLEGLEEDNPDCRWLAAEGLVALGLGGLPRVLGELEHFPDSERKLRGIHHVLSGLKHKGYGKIVDPVLRAYLSDTSQIDIPRAALEALGKLRG